MRHRTVSKSTETDSEDEREEFAYILEVLRQQLLGASTHFYIFEQLWPTEKVVDIINRYKGFFQPTRAAHLDSLIIKVSDILSNNASAPSFYRVLNMIGRNPKLAPGINVPELKQGIRKHKKTLKAVKDYRNKRVAHWITSIKDEEVDKPLVLDTKRMLGDLGAIFNRISASHSNSEWVFKYAQQGDTLTLLEALNKRLAEDQRLIDYWQNRINQQDEGQDCAVRKRERETKWSLGGE